ncbi:MAG: hypothetical protein PHI23_03665, partial [Candidatus Peribacteraceae bacterium]|nr:hypothetical protein [Candidatus Peribacteraceae bacterium]
TRKTTISPREQAILNLPSPEAMQTKLRQKIHMEVKQLHKQIHSISRVSKPGNAFKLNLLYARIRRLNGLLAELVEASFEVLKRLFVRVFIDEQPIL